MMSIGLFCPPLKDIAFCFQEFNILTYTVVLSGLILLFVKEIVLCFVLNIRTYH